ncbi:uncharacterized protein TA10765 [Theileria annulata]|uniref:Uncharacterized protein n=1 Tax=Theileria annulata TaxID=5874 RepID=Q4U949_THEAN|nr:uncharacterized protein TA10765 [Theileria annulata]CAI76654.1 hypothetical protein TA10765 [Theileria annulata]|eukprot:XP_953279.1 hypothetical protein TA10765 [Theileria annulata]
MESKRNGVFSEFDGFPWHNLPRKERVCNILRHYTSLRSHADKEKFYAFLKDTLQKFESSENDTN